MANASSKRIAAQNEKVLSGLTRNLLLINILALAVRYMKSHLYGRSLFPGSRFAVFLQVATFLSTLFLWRWFEAIGRPRRDASGGILRSGDDLTAKGLVDLAWDVVYITWVCTLGSALLGNWVWWLFLVVPGFGFYKAYTVVQPYLGMLLPGVFGPGSGAGNANAAGAGAQQGEPAESKRQAKLKARMERGDKRVQAKQVRR